MEGGPENNQEGKLTENQALEILKSERALTPQEQERLVKTISDADTSIETLMLVEFVNRQFTDSEREHLASNIESNSDAVYTFFINLTESGVLTELNNTEQWLANRLRPVLEQIEDPEAAEYIRENVLPFLPEKGTGQ